MIHELCTVTLHEGRQNSYLDFLRTMALPLRGNAFGVCFGLWVCEFGPLNQVWQLWGYESLEERTRLCTALAKHEGWNSEVRPEAIRLIARQDTRLLKPTKDVTPPEKQGGFYELRIYRTGFAKAVDWANAFRDIMPVREKYSRNVGIWTGEIPADEVLHMWNYPELATRTTARAALFNDPEWLSFLARNAGMVMEMRNILLTPVPFSPLR